MYLFKKVTKNYESKNSNAVFSNLKLYICAMFFNDVIGQEYIKNHLKATTENGRIPHAQLFIGKEGFGTLSMAVAYAQYLLCSTSKDEESCRIKCEKLTHPDLHFAFPVTSNDKVKKHPVRYKTFYHLIYFLICCTKTPLHLHSILYVTLTLLE